MKLMQRIRRVWPAYPARTLRGAAAVLVLFAAVIASAPDWWAEAAAPVAMWVGRHWLAALLFALAGVLAVSAGRRRRSSDDFALPLAAHVAALLTAAIAVAVGAGLALWLAVGQPDLTASAPSGATVQGAGWSAQTTFDGLRAVLSLVAGLGAVVALTVAYRRQRHHETAEQRENTKLFAERFAKAAELLGSAQAAVRLSGVYAMAALADDWKAGRQTCIDVLCAYIRMPYEPPSDTADPPSGSSDPTAQNADRDPREERQVRHTVIRIIRDRLRPSIDKARAWQGHHFDFTGALFDGGDLTYIDLRDQTLLDFTNATLRGTVDFAHATFSGGTVAFFGTRFSGGMASFFSATLSAGMLRFGDTTLSDAAVDFGYTTISGGTVYFGDVTLSGGSVFFGSAEISGGMVSFGRTKFSGGTVDFSGGKLSGGLLDFGDAVLSGGTVSFRGATFSDGIVGFGNVTLSGGTVDFRGLTFPGGTVDFRDATLSGGAVEFGGTELSGGTVEFRDATLAGGRVNFGATTLSGGAVSFGGATFSGASVNFRGARFLGSEIDFQGSRSWEKPPIGVAGSEPGVRWPVGR
ncbi:pentapeptide repeat-containing protein [Catenuloplanes japonicus]|uniref:pentapeptide repeat-containing protein n=1 Tax=Catenuloplanes japonicus TaxID=33876 RepID=UPI0012FB6B15|nr:pentapeptide repeat-containing protein [Catenuloplanes japonicus]